MSNGYDITCDPGALGMQRCYVNVHTPSGCDPAVPPCTVTQQEVIGYTSGGQPISKGVSTSPWMAWVPQLTALNQSGTAYQPYGGAGIPYSLDGGSLVKWNPTDMQALAYLDSAPGAGAREAYQERTCNPLWSNVFGCKMGDIIWVHNDAVAEHEEGALTRFWGWLTGGAETETKEASASLSVNWVEIVAIIGGITLSGMLVGNWLTKRNKGE